MIIPNAFYRGNPQDGTAASGDVKNVTVFDVGATVPAWHRWRIEEILVVNMTQVTGYYSVCVCPSNVTQVTNQYWPGLLNTAALPKSIAGGPGVPTPGVHPIGTYLAFSQPIPPVTTLTMPLVAWAYGNEGIWVGAYPGENDLLGSGGIAMMISGREYRD